jgi:Ca-activated chloride channel homolog
MKRLLIFVFTFFISFATPAQNMNVQGEVLTIDTANLTILNIFPDSFPNVSVIFKAETKAFEPIWNLTKDKMRVTENSEECEVKSLEPISKITAINLGIVVDHSGSMLYDNYLLFDADRNPLYTLDKYGQVVLPEGYAAPIDNAKLAVKNFASTFNSYKDFISVTGFSAEVDSTLLLTQDISEINAVIDSMHPDFATALYDAMIASIGAIKDSHGVKVLVVLSDGHDNSSHSKWEDVVALATKESIPIYIVGLGDANVDTLSQIANETKGQFYFTRSSSSLEAIYEDISKQVQAFYELVYRSPNFMSSDGTRELLLSFDIDSLFLQTNPSILVLSPELTQFLQKKERQKQYILWGGIAIAVLIAAGTILFSYRRKKQKNDWPVIENLYPNPASGVITIEHNDPQAQLVILNLSGQVAASFNLGSTMTTVDIASIPNGTYLAVLKKAKLSSEPFKFIKQN